MTAPCQGSANRLPCHWPSQIVR